MSIYDERIKKNEKRIAIWMDEDLAERYKQWCKSRGYTMTGHLVAQIKKLFGEIR